jgi:hypothetical protein
MPFAPWKIITKPIGEGFKYLKRGVVAVAPWLPSILATLGQKQAAGIAAIINKVVAMFSRQRKGSPVSKVSEAIKEIVTTASTLKGSNGTDVLLGVGSILSSVVVLAEEFKGKSKEEVIATLKLAMDELIGNEPGVLIGETGSPALLTVSLPAYLNLEMVSDLIISIAADVAEKKLAA